MSAGAAFSFVVNDGEADRLVGATSFLNRRIRDVMRARERAGKTDTTLTPADLNGEVLELVRREPTRDTKGRWTSPRNTVVVRSLPAYC